MTRRSRMPFPRARGLDRNLFTALAGCDWIRRHHGLLVTGQPAGVGKSWLACALGHKACREDFSVVYHRVPRLFAALALARGDGRYGRILNLSQDHLLTLDDWGPERLNDDQRRDLLEIIEEPLRTTLNPHHALSCGSGAFRGSADRQCVLGCV